MKKYLLISLILISAHLFGQDVSGLWEGFLIQGSGGIASTYNFTIDVKQKGNSVSGHTKISLIKEPDIYGKIEYSGSFVNKEFVFRETKILKENKGRNAFDWCIKTGKLYYSEKGDSAFLSGDWTAIKPFSCTPGSITVRQKLPPKNDNPNNNNQIVQEEKIEKRELKEGRIIVVPNERITIIVSESAKEDGDTISIIFNDVVVLSEHRLTKEEYKFTVNYDPSKQENKLILYAHNVGSIPPNTAKIQIKSGNLKQEIILKSDLNESDVIYFELQN
ncbi:MAG: hypothetical protein JXL97_04265 [Bacteroidales bacterium]|nr:hypothetical protein [Bacteroidales bacterium]